MKDDIVVPMVCEFYKLFVFEAVFSVSDLTLSITIAA